MFLTPNTQLLKIPQKFTLKWQLAVLSIETRKFISILLFAACSSMIETSIFDESWNLSLRDYDSCLFVASLLCQMYPNAVSEFLCPIWIATRRINDIDPLQAHWRSSGNVAESKLLLCLISTREAYTSGPLKVCR